ncbi:MAG: DUF302 domain-containing protein, partial [Candidatus Thiodiazotropha sp. 6PLUC3]
MKLLKAAGLALLINLAFLSASTAAEQPEINITDIKQTVVQMSIKDGVSREDAIQALMSRATEINLKFVARQQVSKELEARGLKTPYLDIFQFCNPEDARQMIMHDPIY